MWREVSAQFFHQNIARLQFLTARRRTRSITFENCCSSCSCSLDFPLHALTWTLIHGIVWFCKFKVKHEFTILQEFMLGMKMEIKHDTIKISENIARGQAQSNLYVTEAIHPLFFQKKLGQNYAQAWIETLRTFIIVNIGWNWVLGISKYIWLGWQMLRFSLIFRK